MNQFRVTACVRVDSRWFGRYAEMCAALFLPAHLLVSYKIASYETKKAPRGCAFARSRNMSQATALGARMC